MKLIEILSVHVPLLSFTVKIFAFQVYILNYKPTWLHVKVIMEIILYYKFATKILLRLCSKLFKFQIHDGKFMLM